jgi:hypothetical protein
MSDDDRRFSRRAVGIGGGIAAALGLGALGLTVPRLLRTHYRSSAYDDLFAQLTNREAATRVGRAILENGMPRDAKALARDLRQRFERRNVGEVTDSDLAQGRLLEAQGWVLPQSLALLCVLAAEEA